MIDRQINELVGQFEKGRFNRRDLVLRLGALFAVGGSGAGAQEAPASTFRAVGLNHIALRVADVRRARDFYIKHLGMTSTRDGGDGNQFLSFSNGFLALFRGEPAAMDHYCYSIEDYDVNRAKEKLEGAGITPRVTGNRIYFPDADGLTVQLAAPEHTA